MNYNFNYDTMDSRKKVNYLSHLLSIVNVHILLRYSFCYYSSRSQMKITYRVIKMF